MAAPTDFANADRVAFRASVLRTAAIFLIALTFVAAGIWFIADPGGDFGLIGKILGVLSIGFFGLGAVVLFREMFRRGDVVTVDRLGIRDARISDVTMPWHHITGLSESTVSGEKFVMLRLSPEFGETLPVTRRARMSKAANETFAATQSESRRDAFVGYAISMRGLTGTHAELVEAINRFVPASDASTG